MNTITFREAIKLVHPDSNPNITNAGEKVKTVMYHKKNESVLYKLMVHWNLIKRTRPIKKRAKSSKTVVRIIPNNRYYGNIRVSVLGFGDGFIVNHTTAQRVYFTQETKARTGKTWCPLNKATLTGIRKTKW